jgi:hypothetical protein
MVSRGNCSIVCKEARKEWEHIERHGKCFIYLLFAVELIRSIAIRGDSIDLILPHGMNSSDLPTR